MWQLLQIGQCAVDPAQCGNSFFDNCILDDDAFCIFLTHWALDLALLCQCLGDFFACTAMAIAQMFPVE